jgi:hypothetical protein
VRDKHPLCGSRRAHNHNIQPRWLAATLPFGREETLLLRPLMRLRHLLCKAMIVLKIGDLNCNHCKALQACWGIDMRRRLEELRPQESERKPVELSPVSASETIGRPTERTSLRTVNQNQSRTASEDELEAVAKA